MAFFTRHKKEQQSILQHQLEQQYMNVSISSTLQPSMQNQMAMVQLTLEDLAICTCVTPSITTKFRINCE